MSESRPAKGAIGRREGRCLAALYLVVATGVALFAMSGQAAWAPYGMLLLVPVFAMAGVDTIRSATAIHREWRASELGANVKRALASLGPAYRVVTRPASLGERDRHVAIGPNGVFLVLSSDDGGRVTASDQRLFVNARLPWRNLVEDCRVEALRVGDRVQRALGRPVPVHAIVCFTRALVAVGQEIRSVKIVQVPRLARLIESVGVDAPLTATDVETVRAELVVQEKPTVVRPIFRLTPRRASVEHERQLTLVGRPTAPHRRHS
jgi:hypothetical protein